MARAYLLARRLHFINRIFGKEALTDLSDFWYFKQTMSNFTKFVVLGQTSSTIKRYKRYVKTSLFREAGIFPLNNDRIFSNYAQ